MDGEVDTLNLPTKGKTMRVEVYKNLNCGLMSVRECSGRVLTHEQSVFIATPRFVVQPAGRSKVLQTRQKNVHAFVRGQLLGFSEGCLRDFGGWDQWPLASYNPYKMDTFYDKATLDPLTEARYAVVSTDGVYYVH